MTTYTERETVDFHPAPNGWTIAYFNPDEHGNLHRGNPITHEPMHGWITEAFITRNTMTNEHTNTDPRRIIRPAVEEAGLLIAADLNLNGPGNNPCYWKANPPEAPQDTDQAIQQAWSSYRREAFMQKDNR